MKKQDLNLKTNKKSTSVVDFFVDEINYTNVTESFSGWYRGFRLILNYDYFHVVKLLKHSI